MYGINMGKEEKYNVYAQTKHPQYIALCLTLNGILIGRCHMTLRSFAPTLGEDPAYDIGGLHVGYCT